jgi:hypothetical protein
MNVPVYGNVLTNDYDVDDSSAAKDGIHVTAMNGSAANVGQACLTIGGTFLLNSNGSFTYTPNPDFHGTDTFTYQIKDHCGLSSSVSTLIFTVTSGAKTQGYWKTHAAAWPVSSITIAGISYTKSEAIAIMNLSTTGNAISSLWQQLVAAKLNILSGVVAAAADIAAINDAEAAITLASTQQSFDHTNHKLLINTHGVLCWNDSKSTVALVNPSSTLGMRMVSDLNTLTAFNQTGT